MLVMVKFRVKDTTVRPVAAVGGKEICLIRATVMTKGVWGSNHGALAGDKGEPWAAGAERESVTEFLRYQEPSFIHSVSTY